MVNLDHYGQNTVHVHIDLYACLHVHCMCFFVSFPLQLQEDPPLLPSVKRLCVCPPSALTGFPGLIGIKERVTRLQSSVRNMCIYMYVYVYTLYMYVIMYVCMYDCTCTLCNLYMYRI